MPGVSTLWAPKPQIPGVRDQPGRSPGGQGAGDRQPLTASRALFNHRHCIAGAANSSVHFSPAHQMLAEHLLCAWLESRPPGEKREGVRPNHRRQKQELVERQGSVVLAEGLAWSRS